MCVDGMIVFDSMQAPSLRFGRPQCTARFESSLPQAALVDADGNRWYLVRVGRRRWQPDQLPRYWWDGRSRQHGESPAFAPLAKSPKPTPTPTPPRRPPGPPPSLSWTPLSGVPLSCTSAQPLTTQSNARPQLATSSFALSSMAPWSQLCVGSSAKSRAARLKGATVATTVPPTSVEWIKDLGASEVINFNEETPCFVGALILRVSAANVALSRTPWTDHLS